MTINKSQGQTLRNMGVWLIDSCFGHGQLHVAVSSLGSPDCIMLAIRKSEDGAENATSNVFYDMVK